MNTSGGSRPGSCWFCITKPCPSTVIPARSPPRTERERQCGQVRISLQPNGGVGGRARFSHRSTVFVTSLQGWATFIQQLLYKPFGGKRQLKLPRHLPSETPRPATGTDSAPGVTVVQGEFQGFPA